MLFVSITFLALVSSALAKLNHDSCGRRPLVNTNKVLNGVYAKPGDWGWSVSLTFAGEHFCGGILIDEYFVLTAAHCLDGDQLRPGFAADVGVHNRMLKEPWVQTIEFEKFYLHESYDSKKDIHDIAIIKLRTPVVFDSKYIIPVCFDQSETNNLSPEGEIGYVTGWGQIADINPVSPIEKIEGKMKILSKARCDQIYKDLHAADNSSSLIYPDNQICAVEKGDNEGACYGDSGGPLVTLNPIDRRWYLQGVVSWGPDGCGKGSVFARVHAYHKWIEEKMLL